MSTAPAASLRRRLDAGSARAQHLEGRRAQIERSRRELAAREAAVATYLGRADAVAAALERLGDELFGRIVAVLEDKLSLALREILGQDLKLRIVRSATQREGLRLDFTIERNGEVEDILHGQGGSVANILSVGLRIFSLVNLDAARHRPFLLLDEQDCWLRPDLVPALVRIVRESGERLGIQTLMISHHDVALFEDAADRIVRFEERDGRVVATTTHGERRRAAADAS